MKRIIRKIHWFFSSKLLIAEVSKIDSVLTYPMITWLAFEAREKFLEVGRRGFGKVYTDKVDELADQLRKAITPEELKPINERYWSKTQTIARISTMNEQERKQRMELVEDLDRKLGKTKFRNGEASLN